MANHRKEKRADVPAGHHDPLSYAISTRDKPIIEPVGDAVSHQQVLADQPVVSAHQRALRVSLSGCPSVPLSRMLSVVAL